MPTLRLRFPLWTSPMAFVLNLLWAFVAYVFCRLFYLAFNWTTLAPGLSELDLWEAFVGASRFDLSAILYTNALYALMMLFPWIGKERSTWQRVAKWWWWLVNGAAVFMNLADAIYFPFTGRRSTMTMFVEFQHEGNLAQILFNNLISHWYILLVGGALLWGMWRVYVMPSALPKKSVSSWVYHLTQVFCLLAFVPLCVAGMRGGFTTAIRPITISTANQYVNRPSEAALLLNTPFSLIRTVRKRPLVAPRYYTEQELKAVFDPVHRPADAHAASHHLDGAASDWGKSPVPPSRPKNVVVLILESFGAEYSGRLHRQFLGTQFQGYTPFLDSLMEHSATWEHSFANGRKSIDAMPSVLSSIPMMVEPFFLTSASLNRLSGLAGELKKEGYTTAFFHGAENGSMGFLPFARSTGFARYYGRTEYNEDKRFGGDKDFDGTWAIWDEPFLQYYATQLGELRPPFMTAFFSASSHDPFRVPEHLKAKYPEEGGEPLHKCVRYSDNALRQFFATARRQSWYEHTIFVITADHTSISSFPEYQTPQGLFRVPIIIYDPSGGIPPGQRPGIAQQIDIMPTLLGYLGYPRPYVAFGQDLFRTPAADTYAVAYSNGQFLLTQGRYVLAFDGERTVSIYDYVADPMMKRNLLGRVSEQKAMERRIKGIVQSYMERASRDQLTLP